MKDSLSARPAFSARFKVVLALAVAGAGVAGGCKSYAPPEFRVVDAALAAQTDDGAVLRFTIEGTNPNDEPLPLRDVRYSLDLGSQRVFTGARQADVTLHAGGTQRFDLPVSVPSGDAAGLIRDGEPYRLSATVVYQVPGTIAEVLFDSKIRRPTRTFAEEGVLGMGDAAGE